jgi:branched-chain amino acid transport system substrate-binding protein
MLKRLHLIASVAALVFLLSPWALRAQSKYNTGASDTEIKIGNVVPYSGPVYGLIGKVEAAYFKMINDQGGLNGRKDRSYDDG